MYVYVDAAGTALFTDAPGESSASDAQPVREVERPAADTPGIGRYTELILRIANEENVDPDLVQVIIQAESNFDSVAVSRKGARGLMQLMPATAVRFAVPDAFDPEANIRGGIQYLRVLQGFFPGRLPLVLAAYNAGENAVLRYQGIPPYAETRQYVARVLALYERRKRTASATASGRPSGFAPPEAPESITPLAAIFEAVDGDGVLVYTTSPAGSPSPQRPSRQGHRGNGHAGR